MSGRASVQQRQSLSYGDFHVTFLSDPHDVCLEKSRSFSLDREISFQGDNHESEDIEMENLMIFSLLGTQSTAMLTTNQTTKAEFDTSLNEHSYNKYFAN